MTTPRRIVVDDTDPAINYSSNEWFPANVTQLNTLGNFGFVWNGTTHSTTANGATLSFAFNGTSIEVLGTIVNTDDGLNTALWVCKVDGVVLANGTNPYISVPENNWVLCNQDTLPAGPHNLTLLVQTPNAPFYLDSIQYTPTPDVSFDGAVLALSADDSAISYSSGWKFYTVEDTVEDTELIAQANGAQVTLNFHGTSATLTGFVPHELAHNATTAAYSVDGGPATTFALAGLAADSNTTSYNVPILSVSGLTPAAHNIVVTYGGAEQYTPLVVNTWFITNSTIAAPPSTSSSASIPSHTSTSGGTTKHTPTGAIAGGVVGGLALIGLLAALGFWLRRRRQRWSDDTPHRPGKSEPRFAFDSKDLGTGGVAAGFTVAGNTTYDTGAAAQDLLNPHTESGTATGVGSSPLGSIAVAPSSSGKTPYASVRTLSYEPASESLSNAQPQASTSAGGSSGVGTLMPRNGVLEPLTSQQTKSQVGQTQERVVVQQHQDSGVRLHSDPENIVVEELPPNYSPD
ncbi:hypothetical protein MSAN_02110600 [Mycena sanguinolenta]|uniref:Uncharacterized protein n=1 Tax=Mycena sanguinolenta TaxID=230812 RepID=A0A8H6XHK5_9AGAR|nr:hypothetical protein MSAN_02110600 [Mycena sanguinolenta]